jgi:tetratricopeptide (TPR) repeat protein
MNRFLVLLTTILLACFSARAEGPDEHYVRIYQMIQDADRLNDSGQAKLAAAKYVEAQTALNNFRGLYPGWNERVVNYRLNYITTKLAPIASTLAGTPVTPTPSVTPAPVTPAPSTTTPPPVPLVMTPVPGSTPTNPIPLFTPTNTAASWSTEFDNQIQNLKAEIERLQADNKMLAAKLKEALSVQPAGIDPKEMARAEERIRTLQKENDLYKVQLAQRASTSPMAVVPAELTAKLGEQTELITTLRSENEILKKQSSEWQAKLDSATNMVREAVAKATASSAAQVEQLNKTTAENIALQKQLELTKQVALNAQRRILTNTVLPADAKRELDALKARVQALEAKPAPYTSEELALFARTPAVLTSTFAASTQPSTTGPVVVQPAEGPLRVASHGIPTGAQNLVRAAERAFANGNYSEAALKYGELLRQDTNNVTTLGNLASAQLELGEVLAAESNVRQALETDPSDYFSLYVLGRLRYRQDKLDEALDALSRSAKLNPNYPDTQNYLGIVLSEKGLRVPAEAALRRAILLQPDNGVAHNNLAVVYATQTPPALALARWHYEKARAAGHSRNESLEKIIGKP